MLKFVQSLKNARKGLEHILKERNFKIHLAASVIVVAAVLLIDISRTDTLLLLVVINSVLSAEAFNTAIEEVTDLQRDKQGLSYKDVGKAKDIAAGAVLVNSFMAIVIGIILIIEYIG